MSKRAQIAVCFCIILAILGLTATIFKAAAQETGVDLSPNYTRRAGAGERVVYRHTLTNTGAATDTFLLSFSSRPNWPMALSASALQVGAQQTGTVSVTLTVPLAAAIGTVHTTHITAASQLSPTIQDAAVDITIISYKMYAPLVMKRVPPVPYPPQLNPITNTDLDNMYTVSWTSAELADEYILEEATNPAFSDARVVYEGPELAWTTPPPGKAVGTYYYRVKARNVWGLGSWSNVQAITVYPLFVGMQAYWAGNGYIRGNTYEDIGWHISRVVTARVEVNTVQILNHEWFDPNPFGWAPQRWYSYYSAPTGEFRSSTLVPDPSFKWEAPWILPYNLQFSNGQIFMIGGQPFVVSGPHLEYTAFGQQVQLWRMTNRDQLLYWDSGGGWVHYVRPGEATLKYHWGTGLLLYSEVIRRVYYLGQLTNDTIRYVNQLTTNNVFSAGRVTLPAPAGAPAQPGGHETDALRPCAYQPARRP